jgi:hypothetical protein
MVQSKINDPRDKMAIKIAESDSEEGWPAVPGGA